MINGPPKGIFHGTNAYIRGIPHPTFFEALGILVRKARLSGLSYGFHIDYSVIGITHLLN